MMLLDGGDGLLIAVLKNCNVWRWLEKFNSLWQFLLCSLSTINGYKIHKTKLQKAPATKLTHLFGTNSLRCQFQTKTIMKSFCLKRVKKLLQISEYLS